MDKDERSELEKKALEGYYGTPEIKKEEKNRYLGEYRERVIKYLNHDQVMEEGTYDEILTALKNPEARKLIIDRGVDIDYAHDYIKLARQHNIRFKRVDSPEFRGDIALVVVSDHAVEVESRKIMEDK